MDINDGMNDILKKLGSFFKNKTIYDDKWMEQINDEYLLEKELKLSCNDIENERLDFEQQLILDKTTQLEDDFLKDDDHNKLDDLVYSQEDVKYEPTSYYKE